jgi:pyridoxamine 5'-phosphate oxidase
MEKYHELREEYVEKEDFKLDELPSVPMDLFKTWYEEAISKNLKEVNAMALTTNTPEGFPHTRFVLLKELEEDGFIFYTNYTSQKGRDLDFSDKVSITFWWNDLERQVRVKGIAKKISKARSKEYFNSRPRSSQIAALASSQSSVLTSKEHLKMKFEEIEQEFMDQPIPYPDFWGGYIIEPIEIEFWQGRESRMHDRVKYTKKFSSWEKILLQP